MTIENVVNQALDLIGYKRRIGNIYDGSPGAVQALDIWQQTRDALLTSMRPDWARKDATLTLLRVAPSIQGSFSNYDVTAWGNAYPPLPWLYEYTSPADNLYPLLVKRKPFTVPEFRPRYHPFLHRIVDSTTETILCNVPDAILIYIYPVLDPNIWPNDFTDAMILTLAKKFETALVQRPHMQQRQEQADDNAAR